VTRYDRTRAAADGPTPSGGASGSAEARRTLAMRALGVVGYIALSVFYLGSAAIPGDSSHAFVIGDLAFFLPRIRATPPSGAPPVRSGGSGSC